MPYEGPDQTQQSAADRILSLLDAGEIRRGHKGTERLQIGETEVLYNPETGDISYTTSLGQIARAVIRGGEITDFGLFDLKGNAELDRNLTNNQERFLQAALIKGLLSSRPKPSSSNV